VSEERLSLSRLSAVSGGAINFWIFSREEEEEKVE
jgi:hypothetical protein